MSSALCKRSWIKSKSTLVLTFIALCFPWPADSQTSMSLSQTDGWSELQLGWPLGAPHSCPEKTEALFTSVQKAADLIRQQCNERNQELRIAGYPACGLNECLNSYINVRGEKNFGVFQLKLGRSEFNDEPLVLLTFNYSQRPAQNTRSQLLECFDPSARVRSLVEDELASWSPVHLAEFCSQ